MARNPKEVSIIDIRGGQPGTHVWSGLREMVDEHTEDIACQAMWTRHACDGCRQYIDIDGGIHSVQAATVDGLAST